MIVWALGPNHGNSVKLMIANAEVRLSTIGNLPDGPSARNGFSGYRDTAAKIAVRDDRASAETDRLDTSGKKSRNKRPL
jgi:hypothetical protein